MKEHLEIYSSDKNFFAASSELQNFDKRRNILTTDLDILFNLLEQSIEKIKNSLYRAIIRGFISLIESDIYGINQIIAYDGYSDTSDFELKFKKTIKHISIITDQENLVHKYLDSKYYAIKNLIQKRNKLTHPKKIESIPIFNEMNKKEITDSYIEYKKVSSELISQIIIGIKVRSASDLKKYLIRKN